MDHGGWTIDHGHAYRQWTIVAICPSTECQRLKVMANEVRELKIEDLRSGAWVGQGVDAWGFLLLVKNYEVYWKRPTS